MKEDTGEAFYTAETYRIKGEVRLIYAHNPRDAEANFHEAIRIARQQGNRMFELRSAVSLARVWFEQGRVAEAHDLLVSIYSQLTEGFDSRDHLSASVTVARLQNGAKRAVPTG